MSYREGEKIQWPWFVDAFCCVWIPRFLKSGWKKSVFLSFLPSFLWIVPCPDVASQDRQTDRQTDLDRKRGKNVWQEGIFPIPLFTFSEQETATSTGRVAWTQPLSYSQAQRLTQQRGVNHLSMMENFFCQVYTEKYKMDARINPVRSVSLRFVVELERERKTHACPWWAITYRSFGLQGDTLKLISVLSVSVLASTTILSHRSRRSALLRVVGTFILTDIMILLLLLFLLLLLLLLLLFLPSLLLSFHLYARTWLIWAVFQFLSSSLSLTASPHWIRREKRNRGGIL